MLLENSMHGHMSKSKRTIVESTCHLKKLNSQLLIYFDKTSMNHGWPYARVYVSVYLYAGEIYIFPNESIESKKIACKKKNFQQIFPLCFFIQPFPTVATVSQLDKDIVKCGHCIVTINSGKKVLNQ